MPDDRMSRYRWYILALSAATATFVATVPFACLPVLFDEIARDLDLTLVQVGTVWGAASLAGIFVSLIAGLLGDRFNLKVILVVSCILVGVTGALRGLAANYLALTITILIYGIVRVIIPITVTKMLFLWFRGKDLGLANGIMAMGMGAGLMLGSAISATWLSPLLGSWRYVLFLYGAFSIVVRISWSFLGKEPARIDSVERGSPQIQLLPVLLKLIRNKALWFLSLTLMLRIGSIIGMTGYLPLYLRGQGWSPAAADGALASFYAVSTLCVVPLSSLSDRLGSRKAILFPALITASISFALLPAAQGLWVWILVIVAGIFMDGFMAITTTMVLETEGIGHTYSGTALGLVFTVAMIGGVVSPPIGNSLAGITAGAPFFFWAALSGAALLTLLLTKETGSRKDTGGGKQSTEA